MIRLPKIKAINKAMAKAKPDRNEIYWNKPAPLNPKTSSKYSKS
jgi:hypothetical protein